MNTLLKSAFVVGLLAVPAAPVWVYRQFEDVGLAWLAFVVAVVFTVMTRAEELAELSLGPVKAKMRQKIDEAAASLDQLRHIGTVVSRVALTDLMGGSFIGGLTIRRRFQLHDETMAALSALGVSDAQKESVTAEWNKGVQVIYHRLIGNTLRMKLESRVISHDEYQSLASRYNAMLRFETWTAPTPGEIERFFSDNDVAPTQEAQGWLDDYRHFLDTGHIRHFGRFVDQ